MCQLLTHPLRFVENKLGLLLQHDFFHLIARFHEVNAA